MPHINIFLQEEEQLYFSIFQLKCEEEPKAGTNM